MGATNYSAYRPWPGGMQALSANSGAAVGLTIVAATAASATFMGPNFAVIVAETVSCRWRDDGTDPSATVGMPLPVMTRFEYDGDLRKIKFAGAAGTQSIVNVSLYTAE